MAISLVGLLALAVPASAAPLSNGVGVQTHLGVGFQGPPLYNPCAYYSNYRATVAFPRDPATSSDDVIATITSPLEANPGIPGVTPPGPNSWEEDPHGTHDRGPGVPGTGCPDATESSVIGNEAGEPKFTVSLAGAVSCSTTLATYQRVGVTINIGGITGCGTITGLSYTLLSVAGVPVCNFPIAPTMCVIGPTLP